MERWSSLQPKLGSSLTMVLTGMNGTDGATENSPTIGLSFIADGHKMGSVDAIRTGHSYDVVG